MSFQSKKNDKATNPFTAWDQAAANLGPGQCLTGLFSDSLVLFSNWLLLSSEELYFFKSQQS